MISGDDASKHIKRFAGLDFYPGKEAAALRELRLAAEAAGSVTILDMVVSHWIETASKCPTPVELRTAVWEANNQHDAKILAQKERTARCEFCDGIGFEIVSGWDPNMKIRLTGAKRCRCMPPEAA